MMSILFPNCITLFGIQGYFNGHLQENLETKETIFIKIYELLYRLEENHSLYINMFNKASSVFTNV